MHHNKMTAGAYAPAVICYASEQSRDLAVLVHVDLLRRGHLGQPRHGSPRSGTLRGGPSFISMLGGNEFRLRQGFACGKTLARRTCGGMTMPQNNPVILPFSSTSIFSAAGTLGSPGMAPHGAARSVGAPLLFQCSAEMNSASAKVLPAAKHLHAALAAA